MAIFGPNIQKLTKKKDIVRLNALLRNIDPIVRSDAAYALRRLAESYVGDASSIPLLNKCLSDEEVSVRSNATFALSRLAKMNVGNPSSISMLNKCLADKEITIRTNAIFAIRRLSKMKVGHASSIPLLNICLSDKEENIKKIAASALGDLAEIELGDTSSIPLLNDFLCYRPADLMRIATNSLGRLAEMKLGDASSIPLLNTCLSESDMTIRTNASYALRRLAEMGIGDLSSIPLLNTCLSDNMASVRTNTSYTIKHLADMNIGDVSSISPLNRSLSDPDAVIRSNVTIILKRLAEMKIGNCLSIPLLNICLSDKDNYVKENAALALNSLTEMDIGDSSSIPILNKCLSDRVMEIRKAAAFALGGLAEIRIGDASSIPLLNTCLSDKDPEVRTNVSTTLRRLAKMSIGDTSSIIILNKCLSDNEEAVQLNSAFTLGFLAKMKVGDVSSIPRLNKCLSDPDIDIRRIATYVIWHLAEINMGADSSIPPLNTCLSDQEMAVRTNASFALRHLAHMKVGNKSSIPLLHNCLIDQELALRTNASFTLRYLAEIGVYDISSIPLLNQCLADKDNDIRRNASFMLDCLAKGGIGDNSSIPLLNRCLADEERDIRGYATLAIGCLAEMKLGDPSSIPLLNICLSDKELSIRGNAAYALGRLAEMKIGNASSISSLNTSLSDSEMGIRWNVIYALGCLAEMNVGDASSIPLLITGLSDNDVDIRKNATFALRCLAEMNVGVGAPIPLLNKCLSDKNVDVRKNATLALRRLAEMKVGDASSINPLNKCLSYKDVDLLRNAIIALRKLADIDIGNEASIPLLEKHLASSDNSIQKVIVKASIKSLTEFLKRSEEFRSEEEKKKKYAEVCDWLSKKGVKFHHPQFQHQVLDAITPAIYERWMALVNDHTLQDRIGPIKKEINKHITLKNEYEAIASSELLSAKDANERVSLINGLIEELNTKQSILDYMEYQRIKNIEMIDGCLQKMVEEFEAHFRIKALDEKLGRRIDDTNTARFFEKLKTESGRYDNVLQVCDLRVTLFKEGIKGDVHTIQNLEAQLKESPKEITKTLEDVKKHIESLKDADTLTTEFEVNGYDHGIALKAAKLVVFGGYKKSAVIELLSQRKTSPDEIVLAIGKYINREKECYTKFLLSEMEKEFTAVKMHIDSKFSGLHNQLLSVEDALSDIEKRTISMNKFMASSFEKITTEISSSAQIFYSDLKERMDLSAMETNRFFNLMDELKDGYKTINQTYTAKIKTQENEIAHLYRQTREAQETLRKEIKNKNILKNDIDYLSEEIERGNRLITALKERENKVNNEKRIIISDFAETVKELDNIKAMLKSREMTRTLTNIEIEDLNNRYILLLNKKIANRYVRKENELIWKNKKITIRAEILRHRYASILGWDNVPFSNEDLFGKETSIFRVAEALSASTIGEKKTSVLLLVSAMGFSSEVYAAAKSSLPPLNFSNLSVILIDPYTRNIEILSGHSLFTKELQKDLELIDEESAINRCKEVIKAEFQKNNSPLVPEDIRDYDRDIVVASFSFLAREGNYRRINWGRFIILRKLNEFETNKIEHRLISDVPLAITAHVAAAIIDAAIEPILPIPLCSILGNLVSQLHVKGNNKTIGDLGDLIAIIKVAIKIPSLQDKKEYLSEVLTIIIEIEKLTLQKSILPSEVITGQLKLTIGSDIQDKIDALATRLKAFEDSRKG